ncbi:hypothetical protein [Pseudomonas kurunegalensis]|uniref:hypothetical protein n=1 Tax=Pseudomonas kurunegalensis TaxID=485880 RepID=UPI0023635B4D|nr:hypothetical protein [Pseudomonas kurunegalensis]MDD2137321.1 hypothetical protein [Pseudomonas kurunegalensis]
MLTRHHSLPTLQTINHARVLSSESNSPSRKSGSRDSAIFAYPPSEAMLTKVDKIADALATEPPCALNGSSLELLSLAFVRNKDWPSDTPLAWKHSTDATPHAAFVPGDENCWVNFDTLSETQKAQSICISHDGKDGYSATLTGKTWEASGEDAIFKLMLAIKGDVATETIGDRPAAELRRFLSENIREQRCRLGNLWSDGLQDQKSGDVSAAATPGNITNHVNNPPIKLKILPQWANLATRPACKYTPVIVSGTTKEDVISMQMVRQNRIDTCRELSMDRETPGTGNWFSFIRGPQLHEPQLHNGTAPAIVLSGGSASKLTADLGKDYSLAWHPKNMNNEPVYLLVHKQDYQVYNSTMKEVLEQNPNMHLIGWDGGKLTGFGAARAAALAFADSLPYRPDRIMMIDQDVVKTEQTRHTNPTVRSNVENLHETTNQPIVAYGVGYGTRQETPEPFAETPPASATLGDFNTPAQQYVSIKAPFREQGSDGIYPAFMVAGGEDMLMSLELNMFQGKRNTALPEERLFKKELQGLADTPNTYWNEGRAETLKALFKAERNTLVEFEGRTMSLDDLMTNFQERKLITSHPSIESYNVAACVIERIILRLSKLQGNA